MPEITVSMKRERLVKLHDELGKALGDTPSDQTVQVDVYGDVDENGYVLHLDNEDMEREEVPAEAVYVDGMID